MKLSLGWIGNIEFFCYPYSNFDKIWIRIGRKVQVIDKYDIPKLMLMHNKSKWFVNYGSDVATRKMVSESALAHEIQNAYEAGIQKELAEDSERQKKDRKAMLKRVIPMKPKFREEFLGLDPILRKMYDDYIQANEVTD